MIWYIIIGALVALLIYRELYWRIFNKKSFMLQTQAKEYDRLAKESKDQHDEAMESIKESSKRISKSTGGKSLSDFAKSARKRRKTLSDLAKSASKRRKKP